MVYGLKDEKHDRIAFGNDGMPEDSIERTLE